MKKGLIFLLLALFSFSTLQAQEAKATPAKATTKKAEVKTAALSPEEIQQKWAAYMTPTEMHKWLASQDGEWEADITSWMDPAAPPTKTKGLAVNKMILGGRYQESVHTGEFFGMPFEGRSVVGYDNSKKVFVSSWYDNFGTGIMNMEGKWDDKTRTLTFYGKCVDPITGKDLRVKEIVTIIDDNNQKIEMFDYRDGKENKTMEIIAKRK